MKFVKRSQLKLEKREAVIQGPDMRGINKNEHPLNSSVQFSRSVLSDSLRPHESQHARPPCPSEQLASAKALYML